MNIAILIGVSKYNNGKNLVGCKNDVEIMYRLLKQSGKYQEILYISDNTTSDIIKSQLPEFVRKHEENKDIDEVFFYYTGHGLFHKEEFHYVLSDYDEGWLNRTTYKNSEIDELLKSLNPKLTLKVVDACHSGIRYVKDVNDVEVTKMLNNTRDKFNNCYFMFSSQFDEYSWANQKISYFTESFVYSIINHKADSIRYRDIIDYISDDFLQKKITQTPYYVIQSNNTEIFSNINSNTRDMLKQTLASFENGQVGKENKETINKLSLLEIIKRDSENYCKDFDEVKNVLNKLKQTIPEFVLNKELTGLFEIKVEFEDENYDDIPNINVVAKSLENKVSDYFIGIEYAKKNVKVQVKSPWDSITGAFTPYENKPKFRDEVRTVIDYYNITEDDVPYTKIIIDFEPKFPNLSKYNCTIIYAFSKVHLNLFYSFNIYKEISWGEYELESAKWRQTEDLIIKREEEILRVVEFIKHGFQKYVVDDLNHKFKNTSEEINPQREEIKEVEHKKPVEQITKPGDK
jgi:hypothetical protein